MASFIMVILWVSVVLGYGVYGDTDVNSGVTQYQIIPNCSVLVPSSEVELFHNMSKKEPLMVLVDFTYTGIQVNAIKVNDSTSRFLLRMATYVDFERIRQTIGLIGIEHLSMTFNSTDGCSLKNNVVMLAPVILISNDFNRTSIQHAIKSRSLYSTKPVCLPRKDWSYTCIKTDKNGKVVQDTIRPLEFVRLRILMALITFYFVVTRSYRFLKTNLFAMIMYSQRNTYTCIDDSDIKMAVNDSYLIGNDTVPSTVSSVLFDVYVSSIFPSVDSFLKERNTEEAIRRPISWFYWMIPPLLSCCLYCISSTLYQSLIFVALLVSLLSFSGKCLDSVVFFIHCNNECVKMIYGDIIGYPCLVRMAIQILSLICWPFYKVYYLYRHNDFSFLNLSYGSLSNWTSYVLKYVFGFVFVMIWLGLCFVISEVSFVMMLGMLMSLTILTMDNLVGIHFIMTIIIFWIKMSSALGNWYKKFFENIVDIAKPSINDSALETMISYKKYSFRVVPNWMSSEVNDHYIKIKGTPIFMSIEGSMMLSKSFFHRCVKIGRNCQESNPFQILAACVWQFICIYIIVNFIAFIVIHLTADDQNPRPLESIGGGVISYILSNVILKDITLPDVKIDKVLKCYIRDLMNAYEESFEVEARPDHVSERGDTMAELSRLGSSTETHELPPSDSNTMNNGSDIDEKNLSVVSTYLLRPPLRRRGRTVVN